MVAGETALVAPLHDAHEAASDLARFLHALHRPAPHDAPRNPWRGVPLDARDALLREHVAAIAGGVDNAAIVKTWDSFASDAAVEGCSRCGYTATCIPGNLLVSAGRLSGVLDFGDHHGRGSGNGPVRRMDAAAGVGAIGRFTTLPAARTDGSTTARGRARAPGAGALRRLSRPRGHQRPVGSRRGRDDRRSAGMNGNRGGQATPRSRNYPARRTPQAIGVPTKSDVDAQLRPAHRAWPARRCVQIEAA